MNTFIANFGDANYLWPECLKRSTVATFEDEDLRPLWLAGDREAYIERCVKTRTAARGITLPRQVASRWFNLADIISGTEHDRWIHREKDELWWTTTRPDPVVVEERPARPGSVVEKVFVLHKPALPWSNKSRTGVRLYWNALHPKAKEFLFTEATFQRLSEKNAAYARALVDGADLGLWHAQDEWKLKAETSRRGAVTTFDPRRQAALRMAKTAFKTAAQSNGQEVTRTVKNKDVHFKSEAMLERYVESLIGVQEGLCAITGLRLQFDGEFDDIEMLCSLDRIDSSGHYEMGNLQVVCKFVNRWKSAGDDQEFRRLIGMIQGLI